MQAKKPSPKSPNKGAALFRLISRAPAFGAAVLAPALFLAGCGPSDNDPGPGGVSVGEARALDEAAEMIEARRLPPETLGTAGQAPETENQSQEEQAE